MKRVELCKTDELAPGEHRRFEVEGRAICLAHCNDGFRAIDDTCSHEDYSLAEGELDADSCEIECWKHGSIFSFVTGEPVTFPATRPVAVFATEVDNDTVSVLVDE